MSGWQRREYWLGGTAEPDWAGLDTQRQLRIHQLLAEGLTYDRASVEALRELVLDERGPLTTRAITEKHRAGDTALLREQRDTARQELREARRETDRAWREGGRQSGRELRQWCNEYTVPSRLRREGVLLAADKLDPPERAT